MHTKSNVCFVPENDTIHLIESRHELSPKEIRRCYYSQEEKQIMQNRCLRDAERWESGDSRPSCIRGLEGLTAQGREAMEAAIYACIDSVIDEQEIQWADDCDDYDRLALISQEVSQQSIAEAIERAIKDEKVARKIYRQDEQMLSPPPRPVRKVSRVDLGSLFQETLDESETWMVEEEDPQALTEEHGLAKKSTMDVDLVTCSISARDNGGHGHMVPGVQCRTEVQCRTIRATAA